uniref:DnaJ homolog subfamily C member 9 n=1 Tax=Strix occidentalis caurina TaxID=311401 RepID=A0A8D0F6P4_STROC
EKKMCELLELLTFGSRDLYGVLGVRPQASPAEIRRGYHRASLRLHPDRAEPQDKEEATRRFQILSQAYAVLSDAEQRALYDEQGTVDEEGAALRGERDWQEYWRLLFKKLTKGYCVHQSKAVFCGNLPRITMFRKNKRRVLGKQMGSNKFSLCNG